MKGKRNDNKLRQRFVLMEHSSQNSKAKSRWEFCTAKRTLFRSEVAPFEPTGGKDPLEDRGDLLSDAPTVGAILDRFLQPCNHANRIAISERNCREKDLRPLMSENKPRVDSPQKL